MIKCYCNTSPPRKNDSVTTWIIGKYLISFTKFYFTGTTAKRDKLEILSKFVFYLYEDIIYGDKIASRATGFQICIYEQTYSNFCSVVVKVLRFFRSRTCIFFLLRNIIIM